MPVISQAALYQKEVSEEIELDTHRLMDLLVTV